MTIQSLLIKYNKIFILDYPNNDIRDYTNLVKSINSNLSIYGYSLSEELFSFIAKQSLGSIKIINENLVNTINEHIGYYSEPLFPNFPDECFKDSDIIFDNKLILNNLFNHSNFNKEVFTNKIEILTNGQIVEINEKEEKLPLTSINKETTILDLIEQKDLIEYLQTLFDNIISMKSSWGIEQKNILKLILKTYDFQILEETLEDIQIKENKMFLLSLYINPKEPSTMNKAFSFCQTTNDVLRLVTAINQGDVSLSTNTLYSLSNSLRRTIMIRINNILQNDNNLHYNLEESWTHRMKYIRLAEVIHSSSKKYSKYKNAIIFFNTMRSKKNKSNFFKSWESQLNTQILNYKDFGTLALTELCNVLKKKPGMFFRKLNFILSLVKKSEQSTILEHFNEIINEIETKKLIELIGYFKNRKVSNKSRMFFILNGLTTNTWIEKNKPLKSLKKKLIKSIIKIIKVELKKRFSNLPPLEWNKIDKKLSHFPVPLDLRNLSKSKVQIPRGSRLKVEGVGDVLRLHTFWKHEENDKRIDVDLSAGFYDKNWNYVSHSSFTNLVSSFNKNKDTGEITIQYTKHLDPNQTIEKTFAIHSGDITTGYRFDEIVGENLGSSEYIDIDIQLIKKTGVRYIVMQNLDFTSKGFDTFNSHTGWSWRDGFKSGEVFEPSLSENKIQLSGKSQTHITMYLDIKKMEIVFIDMDLTQTPSWNTIESNSINITDICKEVSKYKYKMNMKELLKLHLKSRKVKMDVSDIKLTKDIIFKDCFEKIHLDYIN